MKQCILCLILLCVLPLTAAADDYYVDATNPAASDNNAGTGRAAPWRTVGKCAATLQPGDACIVVRGGRYDERVSESTSGSAGSPIRYLAEAGAPRPIIRGFTISGDYVMVSGFEITSSGMSSDSSPAVRFDGTEGVEIRNNHIHDTRAMAIRSSPFSTRPANSCVISGNTITNIGPNGSRQVAIQVWAHHCLIEGNDISHTNDYIRTHGQYFVVRNNRFHDNYDAEAPGTHFDGWQSFCGSTPEASSFTLIEGNVAYNMPDGNSHFGLTNNTDACGGTTTIIVRRNSTKGEIGSAFWISDTTGQTNAFHHKLYNNTVMGTNRATGSHTAVMLTGAQSNALINNIFYDAVTNSSPYSVYNIGASGYADCNLGYMSSGAKSWATIALEPRSILNADPKFESDVDLALRSDSPAIDAGCSLTQVSTRDAGSGRSLTVQDAHFFQDGWAGVAADWLAIGTVGRGVQIESIDYATNTITLTEALARRPGDPVWLYKDSSGAVTLQGNAPDIGAVEFSPVGSGSVVGSDMSPPVVSVIVTP